MAGAIAEVARDTLPPEFHRIDPRTARILLIEAGPRILPALSEKLSAYAERTLTRMGVEVLTSSPVTNCHARGVEVVGKRIDVGTIIWAAGVVASPVASWIGAPRDKPGRVLVDSDLSVPGSRDVFISGAGTQVDRGRASVRAPGSVGKNFTAEGARQESRPRP